MLLINLLKAERRLFYLLINIKYLRRVVQSGWISDFDK